MKKKKILLTLTLCSMLLGTLGISSTIVKAEDKKERGWIDLGTNGLENPPDGDSKPGHQNWRDTVIVFGEYKEKPMNYRMLSNSTNDFGNGGMLLDNDYVLDMYGEGWNGDNYGDYLNGKFLEESFTEYEKNAILVSNKETKPDTTAVRSPVNNWKEGVQPNEDGLYMYSNPGIDNKKIFILSAEELSNTEYGYNSNVGSNVTEAGGMSRWKGLAKMSEDGGGYLTRSKVTIQDGSSWSGFIFTKNENWYQGAMAVRGWVGLSPAMTINPDSIIFSCFSFGKEYAFTKLTANVGIPSSVGSSWKLTLKDDKDFGKGASIELPFNETLRGEEIEITHEAPNTINTIYNNVTAVILDESGENLLYYGSVNTDMNSKKSILTIPEDMELGTYKVRLMGEQWNGHDRTDYGSGNPFETTIKVVDKKTEEINVSYDWLDVGIDGVDLPEAEMIVKGSNYTAKELTLEGYTFDGWYFDKEGKDKFIDGSTLSTNTTLYGRLKKNGIPLIPLEPSKPNDKPNIPLVPIEPSKPTEKPDIPLIPLEPSKPITKPNTPLVPFEPSDKKAENKDTVQTGDKTNIILYLGIMISSIIVLGTICYKDRKNKNIK